MSRKRIHISFLILVFVFFLAFGGSTSLTTLSLSKSGIFNILVVPVFGHGFSKDHGLVLNHSTSDSVLGITKPLPRNHLFPSIFSLNENGWQKFSKFPILEQHQISPEPDQRSSFYQVDYSDKKGLTSYSVAQRKINYTKASLVVGLNVVTIAVGIPQAIKTWGESKGKFHLKDDWKGDGLVQTDELSHFLWGYKTTQLLYWAYDWVGFSSQTSRILSSSESSLILTLVEYPIDAYNPSQGLGISDLVFDYLGVGMALAKKRHSWLNDFDFKFSWKKDLLSKNKTPFLQTYEEYENLIYWLTYRTKLFLPKKLLCFGFGYSVTHSGMQSQRELYGGIGLSIPDFVSLFSKKLGDKSKFLEILYPNIHIKL